jgi:hypothetical protein
MPQRALRVVTVQSRRAVPAEHASRPKQLAVWANSAGIVGQSRPSTVPPFFLIFNFFYIFRKSCKIKKCVENTIRLEKYEINF